MENKTILVSDDQAIFRYPTKEAISYSVKDDGIYRCKYTLDQYGEPMYGMCGINECIIPKEIFIEAFNTYIANNVTKNIQQS